MASFNPDREEKVEVFDEVAMERRRAADKLKREREEAEEKLRAAEQAIKDKAHLLVKNAMIYDEVLATEICERISAGELLINICNDWHMPTMRRCNQWLKSNIDFQSLYRESISDRLNIFEEETIKIADDIARDFKEILRNGKPLKQADTEVISRAKLRVDVRFKHLKAGRPQKWGDTSTLITKSEDEFDPNNMSLEELERTIADIEAKSSVAKSTP